MKTLTPDQRMEGFTELEGVLGPDAHLMSFLAGVAHAEKVFASQEQDDEPVATLAHNGNFKLLRMVGVTVGQPINLYEHPAPKQDDEPVAWLIPGGITERKDLAEANGSNAQPLYLHPAPRKPFVRLTDKELENLGGKYVGPMSDGEFHLMVITQNALEEKNT